MADPYKTVAILVHSPALAEILRSELATSPRLRVRTFEAPAALDIYLRIAPIDLLIADFDNPEAPADRLLRQLRADPNLDCPEFRVLALTGRVTPQLRQASRAAGIDEIIVKPMSPRYVLERTVAWLARPRAVPLSQRRPAAPPRPAIDFSQYSNVVPLFGSRRPLPQH